MAENTNALLFNVAKGNASNDQLNAEIISQGDGALYFKTDDKTIHLNHKGDHITYDGNSIVTNQASGAAKTPAHGGSFNVVTSVAKDDGSHNVDVTTTSIKLPDETTLSKGEDSNTTETLTHGGTFTAVVDTTVSDHKITDVTKTFTMPAETALSKGTDATDAKTLEFGKTFTAVTDTAVSGHKITDTTTTFTMPSETAVSVDTLTAGTSTLTHGGTFTALTAAAKGDSSHNIDVTPTTFTMPTETTLSITNKSTIDNDDLVYTVTNLIESGTKGHTITPTYTGLPTKAYVDKMVTGTVEYLGTVTSLTGLSTTAGKGDFYRVSTAFTFGSETAHVGDILLATKDNPAQNATDWDLIHTEVDSNTWVANTKIAAGYVAAPTASNPNKVWKTDASGVPGWRDDADNNTSHIHTAGTGLTLTTGGGGISGTTTYSANLNSNVSLGTIGTTSKLYAVGVDANNKLCVNVPWTDTNTHASHRINSGVKSDGSTTITSDAASMGTIILGDSGVTAGKYSPTKNTSVPGGGSFTVPSITVNTKGIVTSVTNSSITIPIPGWVDLGSGLSVEDFVASPWYSDSNITALYVQFNGLNASNFAGGKLVTMSGFSAILEKLALDYYEAFGILDSGFLTDSTYLMIHDIKYSEGKITCRSTYFDFSEGGKPESKYSTDITDNCRIYRVRY